MIFDQCHMVCRAVAIKLQHMWTCLSHSWGDEKMTLLNSCQVEIFKILKSLSTHQYRFVSRGSTLKFMLMHPKDKISNDQKKDLVYHWECKADGCNSSYIGEMSRALGERVKEHSKSTTSAILKHCKDFHHPVPSISDLNIIDKDPSQITREAKEAIHIRRLDPNLNRNISKMSIPHCFDHLLGVKPKHP